MGTVLVIVTLIVFILLFVAVWAREGYVEALMYHESKQEQFKDTDNLIVTQRTELLELSSVIKERKKETENTSVTCGLDHKLICNFCTEDCIFKEGGGDGDK